MNDVGPHVETATAPDDSESLYEVIDGRRVEKPPMGAFEMTLAALLVQILGPYARSKRLGHVVPETLFTLPTVGRARRPDVAFVSYERWPRGRRVPRTAAWPVVPDLAIEVVSTTNKAEEINAKKNEYFQCGVRMVWVVWPESEEVHAYTSPNEVRILSRTDTIEGGDVVPGFRLPLSELFEEETNPAPQSPPPSGSSDK